MFIFSPSCSILFSRNKVRAVLASVESLYIFLAHFTTQNVTVAVKLVRTALSSPSLFPFPAVVGLSVCSLWLIYIYQHVNRSIANADSTAFFFILVWALFRTAACGLFLALTWVSSFVCVGCRFFAASSRPFYRPHEIIKLTRCCMFLVFVPVLPARRLYWCTES